MSLNPRNALDGAREQLALQQFEINPLERKFDRSRADAFDLLHNKSVPTREDFRSVSSSMGKYADWHPGRSAEIAQEKAAIVHPHAGNVPTRDGDRISKLRQFSVLFGKLESELSERGIRIPSNVQGAVNKLRSITPEARQQGAAFGAAGLFAFTGLEGLAAFDLIIKFLLVLFGTGVSLLIIFGLLLLLRDLIRGGSGSVPSGPPLHSIPSSRGKKRRKGGGGGFFQAA